jgi:hypothetical protein
VQFVATDAVAHDLKLRHDGEHRVGGRGEDEILERREPLPFGRKFRSVAVPFGEVPGVVAVDEGAPLGELSLVHGHR